MERGVLHAEADFSLYDFLRDPVYVAFREKWKAQWPEHEITGIERLYYSVAVDPKLDPLSDPKPARPLIKGYGTNMRVWGDLDRAIASRAARRNEMVRKGKECLNQVTHREQDIGTGVGLTDIWGRAVLKVTELVRKRLGGVDVSLVEVSVLVDASLCIQIVLLLATQSNGVLKLLVVVLSVLSRLICYLRARAPSAGAKEEEKTDTPGAGLVEERPDGKREETSQVRWVVAEQVERECYPSKMLVLLVEQLVLVACTMTPVVSVLLGRLILAIDNINDNLPYLRGSGRACGSMGLAIAKMISKRHVIKLFTERSRQDLMVFPLFETLLRSLADPAMAVRTCLVLALMKLQSRSDPVVQRQTESALQAARGFGLRPLTLLVDILGDIVT